MAHSRLHTDPLRLGSSLPPPHSSRMLGSEDLPRLTQETELQKIIADEKMRAEQHRTNYQTLKAEHTRLQDEYIVLQTELKSTIEESRLVQDKYKSLLEQLRKELSDKHRECEELKAQVMTPHKLEALRTQMSEELEQPYQDKYQHLEQETEQYRSEYNKLKYQMSFLKSEYDKELAEKSRIVTEMKMRHEAEVANLRKERETLIARQHGDKTSDGQRVRTVQRENAQLHLKLKGLLAELEEIRAQREHSGLQSDNVTRLQTKQLAEHAANVKALETERESFKLQCSSLSKELSNTNQLQTQLTGRIHDLEKENIVLKNRAEETSHKSKVDLTSLKMDMLKERGELERQRDRLSNEIEDLKAQVDIVTHSLTQQEESLVDKEREAVKRVQAAREEEWQKLHAVENEKLELETKLQTIERRKIDEESQRHQEREKTEERLRQATEEKQDAEKELLVVKTKLQHNQSMLESLERERSENSDLKSRLHRIESAYNSYVGSERELVDQNSDLKRNIQDLSAELSRIREQLRMCQDDSDKVMIQNRSSWGEEKTHFIRRIEELDGQVGELHNNLTVAVTTHTKKKKKFTNLVTKLKNKVALYHAKIQELQIEREALKKCVPSTDHMALKKKMVDLTRKHRDYRMLLLSAGIDEVKIGNLAFAGVPANGPTVNTSLHDYVTGPTVDPSLHDYAVDDLDKHHQKELELLKERLDLLDDNQRQQLQELKGISPVESPRAAGSAPLMQPERDNMDDC